MTAYGPGGHACLLSLGFTGGCGGTCTGTFGWWDCCRSLGQSRRRPRATPTARKTETAIPVIPPPRYVETPKKRSKNPKNAPTPFATNMGRESSVKIRISRSISVSERGWLADVRERPDEGKKTRYNRNRDADNTENRGFVRLLLTP